MERDGLFRPGVTFLWLRYTVERTEFVGLADLRRLRPRIAGAIRRLRLKHAGIRSGWALDWTPPFYPDGSRPHDCWIVVVPDGIDAADVRKTLLKSMKRIAKAQKVALHDEPYCEPMKDPRGALGYITGFKKKAEAITLPPAPQAGAPIVSFHLDGLTAADYVDNYSMDYSDDEGWDVEGVDGDRFLYLQKKRQRTPREQEEFSRLQNEYAMVGRLSFTNIDVPTVETRWQILSAFDITSIQREVTVPYGLALIFGPGDRGRRAWVSCSPSMAVRKSRRLLHAVRHPDRPAKMVPYGGEAIRAIPADHVLALNLNISTEDGKRRAYELCDLLEQHTGRPVFRRVSGGKTNGFDHLHVFVVGLTPEVKQEWIDVVDEMRFLPGCESFRVHVDEPIRMPLSPTYYRKPTRTEYGMSYRVNDSRVARFGFDYVGFAEAARFFAEDLSRCEGAGMPPAELPRRARPGRSPKGPEYDRDGENSVYTVRRTTSGEMSTESITRPSSGRDPVPAFADELEREWSVSTYRGMTASVWRPSKPNRRRREPAPLDEVNGVSRETNPSSTSGGSFDPESSRGQGTVVEQSSTPSAEADAPDGAGAAFEAKERSAPLFPRERLHELHQPLREYFARRGDRRDGSLDRLHLLSVVEWYVRDGGIAVADDAIDGLDETGFVRESTPGRFVLATAPSKAA